MIKKISFTLVIVASLGTSLFAQTSSSKTWISLAGVHQEYNGDLGNEMLSFNVPNDMGGMLGIHRYLNPSFAVDLDFMYGLLDTDTAPFFEKNYVSNSLKLRYKLANGYILKEDALIQPYLAAGVSVTPFFGPDEAIADELAIGTPFGGGFDILLGDNLAFFVQSIYQMNFTDQIDGVSNPGGINQDNILAISSGVKFGFGSKNDRDGDRVSDAKDACPDVAGSRGANGCPDRDRDTVADDADMCPDDFGDEMFRGCPDSDEDSVPDYQDQCPEVKGLPGVNGCLDGDNDQVADPIDACPNIAGDASGNGCPDADGDGVRNTEDKCPSLPGVQDSDGCPDADGDRIIDSVDECPQMPGYPSNNGCPEIDLTVQRAVEVIAKNVIFASNSATIDPTSIDDLDVLVQIMVNDARLQLSVEAHTDNRGDSSTNLQLTDERAKIIKKYLVDRGVAQGRITAIGYGQTRPITTNQTASGRLKNRRIELKVFYN